MTTTKARSATALMKMIGTNINGGEVRVTLTSSKTIYANAYPSRETATLQFSTEAKQQGFVHLNLGELTIGIERKLSKPIAGAEGPTIEAALEALLETVS